MSDQKKHPKADEQGKWEEIKDRWNRFKELAAERHVSEDHQFWDNVYYVTKIVFAAFLFLAILCCAVVSKGALLLLTWNLFTPYNGRGNKLKTLNGHLNYTGNETGRIVNTETETNVYYIWALFMMVVTPNFLSALFFLLRLRFKGRQKFLFKPLLLVLITSTVHTIGLTIFVFSLLPTLDPFCGLLYCSSVTCIPAVLQSVFRGERQGQKETRMFILTLTSIPLFFLSIIFWTVYVAVGSEEVLAGQIALYFICPILVSFGWIENLLPNDRIQTKSDQNSENTTDKKQLSVEEEKKLTFHEHMYLLRNEIYKGRYIIFLVANVWKILLTFLLILAIFGDSCEEGALCLEVLLGRQNNMTARLTSTAFGNTWLYHGTACALGTPFIVAAVGMGVSFLGQRLCVAAIKIVAQVVSFYIPLVLTTPATLVTAIIVVANLNDTSACRFPFPWWDGNVDTEHWWFAILGALFGYLSLIFATTFIWTNNVRRMETEDKLFLKPLYSGALFDQSVLLGRQRDYKKPKEDTTTNVRDDKIEYEFDIPMLYLCATMWHETETEMTQILTSLFRMDIDQCVRSLTHASDGDYYKFEAHILFDDAFKPESTHAGEYVEIFTEVIKRAASDFYPKKFLLQDPIKVVTPYGGRLVYTLPGTNDLVVHLKDKSKIRNKKRWSQVMYMYYFLAHKIEEEYKDPIYIERRAKNTFILALDGDVDFRPQSVKLLIDRMKRNPLVGAACGRIHPIGGGPMVWYQKFEYAVSHWLIKATEHVTGCVLCSPGCFSLFRGSALMEVNVMKKYTTMPSEARHHIQYDQGEDRWLCTLLLKQGKKIDYCAASDAYTFAPEGFKEFFKQRRRWTPSTMANIMEILEDWRAITKKNSNMSLPYIMLQAFWFFSSVLTPGVLFMMIVGAVNLAYPALSIELSLLLNLGVLVAYVLTCFFLQEKHQLNFASGLSILYAVVMMIVLVGLIRQSAEQGICSITPIFSIFVVGVFVIAGLSHPKEMLCLIHGPLFFIAIPAMSMLLLIYSIINLNNVSWGTREASKPPPEKGQAASSTPDGVVSRILGRIRLRCQCCTGSKTSSQHEQETAEKLDEIRVKISNIEENMKFVKKKDIEIWESPSAPRVVQAQKEQKSKAAASEPSTSGNLKSPALDFSSGEKLNENEEEFWKWLIETYLFPLTPKKEDPEIGQVKVENSADMKNELRKFRNKASLAFLLLNALFVTIIFFLQKANKDTAGDIAIHIRCSSTQTLVVEPISVSFTVMFGILLVISFICMLIHRWKTFLQINSMTPFRREINIEQLLMDSFEDLVDNKLKQEAKPFQSSSLRRSRGKQAPSFRRWLIRKLRDMETVVIQEEDSRNADKRPPIRKFRAGVRKVQHITTLGNMLKSMSNQQVTSLKMCIEKAMDYNSKQPKPAHSFRSVVLLASEKRREEVGYDNERAKGPGSVLEETDVKQPVVLMSTRSSMESLATEQPKVRRGRKLGATKVVPASDQVPET